MMLFLSIALSLTIGFLLSSIIWPDRKLLTVYLWFRLALSAGIGLGLSSVLFFLWLACSGHKLGFISFAIIEIMLALALGLILFMVLKKMHSPSLTWSKTGTSFTGISYYILVATFWCTIATAVFAFIFKSVCEPHGGWDAWAIWNMKARFFVRGPEQWTNIFSPAINWINADYPLFLPCLIARFWKYTGAATVTAPILVAFFFTFATAILLYTSLALLRGKVYGILGSLVLVSTPFFIMHGASQYADAPVGFFFLATIILSAFADTQPEQARNAVILAGITAGLAAWTKNEGILFFLCFMAARLLTVVPFSGFKKYLGEISRFIAGALPILIAIAYFKIFLAPVNRIMIGSTAGTLEKLTDISRYFIIMNYFFDIFRRFGFVITGTLSILIIFIIVAGVKLDKCSIKRYITPLATLILMFTGYLLTLVQSPFDLLWQLGTTANRLVVQLWPLIIFLFFMLAETPSPPAVKPQAQDKDRGNKKR